MQTQQSRISHLKELVAQRTSKKDEQNSTQQQIAQRRIRLFNEAKIQRERRLQYLNEKQTKAANGGDSQWQKNSQSSSRLSFADYRIQHDTDKYAQKMIPIPSGKPESKEGRNKDVYFEQEKQDASDHSEKSVSNQNFWQPPEKPKEKQPISFNIFADDNPLKEFKPTSIFSFDNSKVNTNTTENNLNIFGGNKSQEKVAVTSWFSLNFANNTGNVNIFTQDNPFFCKSNHGQQTKNTQEIVAQQVPLVNEKQVDQKSVQKENKYEVKQIKLFGNNVFSLSKEPEKSSQLQTAHLQPDTQKNIFEVPVTKSQSILKPSGGLFSGINLSSQKKEEAARESFGGIFGVASSNMFSTGSSLFSLSNSNQLGNQETIQKPQQKSIFSNNQEKPSKQPSVNIFTGGPSIFDTKNLFGGNSAQTETLTQNQNQNQRQKGCEKTQQKQDKPLFNFQQKSPQKSSASKNLFQLSGSKGGLFASTSGIFGGISFPSNSSKQESVLKQSAPNIFGGNSNMFATNNMFSSGGSYIQPANFGNIFSGPNIPQKNQENDQEEGQEEQDEGPVAEEDGADPMKSTGNYKDYTETETLFKQTATKFKREKQGSDLIQNVTISIEKIPSNEFKRLIVRFANKSIPDYGDVVIHPAMTEMTRMSSNSKSFVVKKLIRKDYRKSQQGSWVQENFKIMFREDAHGDQFMKAFQSKKTQ